MNIQDKLKQAQDILSDIQKDLAVTPKQDIKFTKDKFMSFYGLALSPQECYDAVRSALDNDGILTDMTLIGALATIRVEVGRNFKPIEEYASGQAYEGRIDLGNIQAGDGVRYKGRGYIQLTGRGNYTNYGKIFNIDLVNKPELALGVDISAKILSRYFKDRGVNIACDSNDWVLVRKKINGGSNGLSEFQRVVSDYLSKLN